MSTDNRVRVFAVPPAQREPADAETLKAVRLLVRDWDGKNWEVVEDLLLAASVPLDQIREMTAMRVRRWAQCHAADNARVRISTTDGTVTALFGDDHAELRAWLDRQRVEKTGELTKPAATLLAAIDNAPNAVPIQGDDSGVRSLRIKAEHKFPGASAWFMFCERTATFVPGRKAANRAQDSRGFTEA